MSPFFSFLLEDVQVPQPFGWVDGCQVWRKTVFEWLSKRKKCGIIGRFWEIGPQKRLYIPAPLLKKGNNTILVLETEGKAPGIVELCDEPDLG